MLHITSSQPFHLFLRLRTDPSMTFQFLLHALAPLHDASLLSSFCPKSNLATPSLVAVVCAGAAAPLDDMLALSPRYVFAEAPIADDFTQAVREVTPVVSGSLFETTGWDGSNSATEEQLARVRAQVTKAHDAGLLIRYTDLPRCVPEDSDVLSVLQWLITSAQVAHPHARDGQKYAPRSRRRLSVASPPFFFFRSILLCSTFSKVYPRICTLCVWNGRPQLPRNTRRTFIRRRQLELFSNGENMGIKKFV